MVFIYSVPVMYCYHRYSGAGRIYLLPVVAGFMYGSLDGGGSQNLPSDCWRVAGFMYGSLDGDDSFHPRGFPLSPLVKQRGVN